MNKAFIWIAIVLGGLFGLFMLTAPTTEEAARNNTPSVDTSSPLDLATENAAPKQVDESTKTKLFIGSSTAPVTLVEYGDFKCPACGQFHQVIGQELRQKYIDTGQLKIEFRNFPFIGPDSGRAARGTYCAHNQGGFQAYHDAVYDYMWDTYYASGNYASEFEDILTTDLLIEIAGDSVADQDKLRSCIDSDDVDSIINDDVALAQWAGVTGTPGFTFDGQKINGPLSIATLETLINTKL